MVSFTFVGGERTLKPEKILYVQTDGHRNVFTVLEGSERVELNLYKKLDEIERVLKPYGFVRSHRSLMVNMRYVKSVSNYLMELTTGTAWRSGAALTDLRSCGKEYSWQ